MSGGDIAKTQMAVSTGGLSLLAGDLLDTTDPQAAPKAPAPVTQEDPNVKEAANLKRRRLAKSSRRAASTLSPSQSRTTLG